MKTKIKIITIILTVCIVLSIGYAGKKYADKNKNDGTGSIYSEIYNKEMMEDKKQLTNEADKQEEDIRDKTYVNIEGEQDMINNNLRNRVAAGKELLALVNSEQEAAEIADEYNIKLVSYIEGVATYSIGQEKLSEILNKEKEGDRNRLYVNYVRSLQ